MICYMLIMNMPLWITVYLRNKWCLNLESWHVEYGRQMWRMQWQMVLGMLNPCWVIFTWIQKSIKFDLNSYWQTYSIVGENLVPEGTYIQNVCEIILPVKTTYSCLYCLATCNMYVSVITSGMRLWGHVWNYRSNKQTPEEFSKTIYNHI